MEATSNSNFRNDDDDISKLQELIESKEKLLLELKQQRRGVHKAIQKVEHRYEKCNEKGNSKLRQLERELNTEKGKLDSELTSWETDKTLIQFLRRFMDVIGLSLKVNSGKDANGGVLKIITFHFYKRNVPPCMLYFSELNPPTKITIIDAGPRFQEFDEFAAEANQTKDFPKIIIKAREYFLRHLDQMPLDP